MAFGRLFLSVVGVGFDLVICTPEPPSTWYIQISLETIPNCAFETKMYFPSGAQLGELNSLLASLETCFTPVPSGCMIQMFSLPSRSEMKVIHCPSGENFGWLSKAIPPEISFAWPPSMGSVKMSPSSSNTMVLPSGEASSESQVPSSVMNSTFRSDFNGRPFFSSFFSFFSSFFFSCLSFSCATASCRWRLASSGVAPPKMTSRTMANTTNHAVRPRRLGCFTGIVDFPLPSIDNVRQEFTDGPWPADGHTLFRPLDASRDEA